MRINDLPSDFTLCRDYVFKAIFTKDIPESKGALTSLLSAFLGRKISSAVLIPNEPPVDNPRQRQIRYDISVKFEDGELADIEIMLDPKKSDVMRMEYYLARLFLTQESKGKDMGDLKRSWQLSIADRGNFFDDEEIFHHFVYFDPERNITLGGLTSILTLELNKLDRVIKRPVSEMSGLEHWSVFFKHYPDEDKRELIDEIIAAEEGIAMAEQVIQGWTQSEIEGIKKMYADKWEMDYWQEIHDARREGRAEGMAEGQRELMALLKSGKSIEEIEQILSFNASQN